jgi:hypothetical protein
MQQISAQADQALSNLVSPTSIPVTLRPKNDSNINLGTATKSWRDLYLDGTIYIGGLKFIAFKAGTGRGNTTIGLAALNANTSGSGNTAMGDSALLSNTTGDDNTANGTGALYNNSTGHDNTAVGQGALLANENGNFNTANGTGALNHNTTGWNNTAIGGSALENNTTGNGNTATGFDALSSNEGGGNTATGEAALEDNITGNGNTAFGYNALSGNTSLSNLVAVGDNALYSLDGGSGHCTAVGSEAGYRNTTGGNNTYLGYHAGNTVTTGSSNTIIGYGADISSGTLSNATAIGNLAVANASNKVRIGNSSVTSIGGQVSWTTGSDERIKTNVQQNVPGLKFINLLKPVTYSYDVDKEDAINGIAEKEKPATKYDIQKMQFTGFLAQEVEKAAKQISYDFSGVDVPKNDKDIYGLRYSDFVVPLVKAVQELSKLNDDKDVKIDVLQKENNDLAQRVTKLEAMMHVPQLPTEISSASLQQNIPNPFNHTTTIGYSLFNQFSSAQIIITDKNGRQLKQINLSRTGKGTITIDASAFASGAYNYALYVDGRFVASKQMVLTK